MLMTFQLDIEAISGTFWHEKLRYQHNVGFKPEYTKHLEQQSIGYLYQPIPVYWIEHSKDYNEEGHAYYWEQVRVLA